MLRRVEDMVEKNTELEKKQAEESQEFAAKLQKLLEEARKKCTGRPGDSGLF